MNKWISIGKYGIRYREHNSQTVGVGRSKRPLRYYTSVYKHQGKVITDVYGWERDDFRDEDEVVSTAVMLRQNRKAKIPPFTLKELLDERQSALDREEEERLKAQVQRHKEERTKLDAIFEEYCVDRSDRVSLKDEKGYYKNWIKPTLGDKRLDEIRLLDLERIRHKMTKANRAPRSIVYIRNIVRQVYHYAIKHGLYKGDIPTKHFLENLKVDNKRQRYLSPEEAGDLLEKIRITSEQTYRICTLSLNTGMRFGEIAALLWQHIDLKRRSILVVDPKNAESRRVFMTDTVVELFEDMEHGKPSELVFPDRNGRKMIRISKTFSRAVDQLGLNDDITDRRLKIVFHSLRHSCASWLVNSGVELPIVAKILGHKTLQMTMRYSHVNDTSVQNAMRTLDQQQSTNLHNISINE